MADTSKPAKPNRAESATLAMTQGPIAKALVRLAVPIVLSNMLQTAYQLVDAFWVGRLGAGAVASVSACFPVIFLMIALGGGLAVVGSVFVAQNAGARNYDAVNHVAGQTFLMVLAVSVLLTIIGYSIKHPLLSFLGVPAEIFEQTQNYLSVSIIGVIFMFTYFIFEAIMRGIGETRLPLMIVSMTVLLNLILDPFFIFGWGSFEGLGVTGAAYATIITQGLAALIGFSLLASNRIGIHLKLRELRPDFPFMKTALFVGLPASVEQSSRAVGVLMLTFLVNRFGETTMAVFGTGFRFMGLIIIPALGLSIATATLVGQNLGAGNPGRAEQVGSLAGRIAFVLLTLVGGIMFVFAKPLVAFFIPNEPEVITEGTYLLRIMAFSFGFMGWQQALLGVFRGAGQTVVTMAQAILSLWLIQFPLAFSLSQWADMGPDGIWWSFPSSAVLTWTVTYVWYRRGGWKTRKLTTGQQFKAKVNEEIVVEEGVR